MRAQRANFPWIAVVVVLTIASGASWAHAALTMNAHVRVGDARLGLGWTVTNQTTGGLTRYATRITVTLPKGISAAISKKAPNETVVLERSSRLACGPEGIEVDVTYRVTPRVEPDSSLVAVKVAKVAGQKSAATGDILVEGEGRVGETIRVHLVIPGPCR